MLLVQRSSFYCLAVAQSWKNNLAKIHEIQSLGIFILLPINFNNFNIRSNYMNLYIDLCSWYRFRKNRYRIILFILNIYSFNIIKWIQHISVVLSKAYIFSINFEAISMNYNLRIIYYDYFSFYYLDSLLAIVESELVYFSLCSDKREISKPFYGISYKLRISIYYSLVYKFYPKIMDF